MRSLISTLFMVLLVGCGSDVEPPGSDGGPGAQTTWYQHVAPLVAQHCMSCHQPTGIAPFPLTTYEDAVPIAPMLLAAVEAGVMPPWDAYATPDCTPTRAWKHDPRLAPAEVDLLRAWIADGTPAGTPAEVEVPAPPGLANPTHSLTPQPYTTSGSTDEFICFLLDPATTEATWLTGLGIRPGNPKVVHHAVINAMPAELMDLARDTYGVGVPFACSGGAGVPSTELVGAWAPGGPPLDTAPDIGLPIPAGTGFVVQIHYHPGGVVNAPDATTIDLRLDPTPTPYAFTFRGFGNSRVAPTLLPGPNDAPFDDDGDGVEFLIPAGASGHTETMQFRVGAAGAGQVFMAFPHMHYVGVAIHAKLRRVDPDPGEPAEECLINIDRWDFNWQRSYQYDVPVTALPAVEAGDRVEIKCTYENTLANPFVQLALMEQGLSAPINVAMGESTLEEMCLVLFGAVTRR